MCPSRFTRTVGQLSRAATDVGRLARAVGALNEHATILCEPGQDRQRHIGVESIRRIDRRNVVVALGEGQHLQVRSKAEGGFDVDGFGRLLQGHT